VTHARRLVSDTVPAARAGKTAARRSYSVSKTSRLIAQTPSAATFSSPLRPNLTGGALPRSAGGYSLGGSAGRRAFSHVPAAQAQLVQNVSAAVRAFLIGGGRAKYAGRDPRTGEKRFVSVGVNEDKIARTVKDAKVFGQKEVRGTSVEFCVVPQLDAMDLGDESKTLNGVMKPLAGDFARSLSGLAAVHGDLKRLSELGDLPITQPRPGWIAVRFPGCDAEAVASLCDEVGVSRGIIREDASWMEEKDVRMALLFPSAPSDAENEDDDAGDYFYSPKRPAGARHEDEERHCSAWTVDESLSPLPSTQLSSGQMTVAQSFEHVDEAESMVSWRPNPWEEDGSSEGSLEQTPAGQKSKAGQYDVESIYRFLAECDQRIAR